MITAEEAKIAKSVQFTVACDWTEWKRGGGGAARYFFSSIPLQNHKKSAPVHSQF